MIAEVNAAQHSRSTGSLADAWLMLASTVFGIDDFVTLGYNLGTRPRVCMKEQNAAVQQR